MILGWSRSVAAPVGCVPDSGFGSVAASHCADVGAVCSVSGITSSVEVPERLHQLADQIMAAMGNFGFAEAPTWLKHHCACPAVQLQLGQQRGWCRRGLYWAWEFTVSLADLRPAMEWAYVRRADQCSMSFVVICQPADIISLKFYVLQPASDML